MQSLQGRRKEGSLCWRNQEWISENETACSRTDEKEEGQCFVQAQHGAAQELDIGDEEHRGDVDWQVREAVTETGRRGCHCQEYPQPAGHEEGGQGGDVVEQQDGVSPDRKARLVDDFNSNMPNSNPFWGQSE